MPDNKTSSLAKNSIYYSASTMICMVIPLIFYPYITRILGPTYYGKISFEQTLISYFVILATLGINNYAQKLCAVNGKDKKKLSKGVHEVLIIAVILTAVSSVVYIGTVLVIDIAPADYPLYFVSIGMILFSSLRMDWLLVAKERFFYIAARDVISKMLLLVGCFLLVKRKEDFILFGLLYAIAYAVLPSAMNYAYIGKSRIIERPNRKTLSLREHIQPIVFLSLVTIGSKIFSSADIIMLRFFQGEASVGIYNNAIKLPLVLDELLMAVAAVVTPRMYAAVRNKNEEEIHNLVNYASNTMFFFAVPAIVTCIFFSDELVRLLGGQEYVSGSAILIVYSFIILTTLCLTIAGTRMYIAKNMEKQLFLFLLVAGIFNIGLNAILIPRLGGLGAALASVISNFFLLVVELTYAHTAKYLFDRDKLKYVFAGIVLAAVFMIIHIILKERTTFRLAISILVGGIIYVILLIAQKESTVTRILSSVKAKLGG